MLGERARPECRAIAQPATFLPANALVVADDQKERRRALLAQIGKNKKRPDFSCITAPEVLIRSDRDR